MVGTAINEGMATGRKQKKKKEKENCFIKDGGKIGSEMA